ncbi:MAG: glycosyltransferase [Chloroflexi bacterium]|nr:glycosyltransferase [Chloroflexota bacterium]
MTNSFVACAQETIEIVTTLPTMRILHIYKDYFPVLGGIENHVRMLAEAQAARGHAVTVLVTSLNRHSHVENVNGVRVFFASRLLNLSSAPFSFELFRRVAEIETDVTHLHAPYPVGEVAQLLFGRTRATVLTYHSDIVRQKVMGKLYTPLLHRVLARVDAIIATSPNYIETSRVLARWKNKCVVVPLGIPPTLHLTPNPSPKGRGENLLFVGRLRYYKGVNYLLEALTMLPSAQLTIVGTGPMEREWKALANSLGVASRVRWAGQVSDAELPAFYAACDIFVLPCSERSEAFGAVQLEAMGAGKAIVSCDVNTGVAWVNQNEVTGLVAPPKNPRALAEALARLRDDASLREQMGRAGRERFQREFTLDVMVGRVMRVYENLVIHRK